jgi:hypothetical protein
MPVPAIWLGALCVSNSHLAGACKCSEIPAPCHALAAASMVFIGRVESIMPPFLDRWNLGRKKLLSGIIDSDDLARSTESGARLEDLKAKIRETIVKVGSCLAQRLAGANTHNGVIDVFNDIFGRGRVVRFRVNTVFAGAAMTMTIPTLTIDDDKTGKLIDVTTPFGKCEYDFQQAFTAVARWPGEQARKPIVVKTCGVRD